MLVAAPVSRHLSIMTLLTGMHFHVLTLPTFLVMTLSIGIHCHVHALATFLAGLKA